MSNVIIVNKFKLIKKIGKGSFGDIYIGYFIKDNIYNPINNLQLNWYNN